MCGQPSPRSTSRQEAVEPDWRWGIGSGSGGGLYAGEAAVIEKMATGVIPAALVRTEAGRTRQVRTIDLEPIAREG